MAHDRRPEVLSQLCEADAELRSEVEALLAAHDSGASEVDRILEALRPPAGPAAPEATAVTPAPGQAGADDIPRDLADALSDRFEIRQEIGRGGMATVYLARDRSRGGDVALKVMRADQWSAAATQERFHREIEATLTLNHPHIVPLLEWGSRGSFLYYEMPYVEGETLRERLRRRGTLSPREAVRLASEVASALAHAHGKGVIHRDIKPANVLLSSGLAQLSDFGIARFVGSPDLTRLTNEGAILGTVAYMPPEALDGEGDARSDLYALGCVLYESLCGSVPSWSAPDPGADLVALRRLRPGLPKDLRKVIERTLARDPEERFQTAQELLDALEAVDVRPARWRGLAGALGVAALVVAGLMNLRTPPSLFDQAGSIVVVPIGDAITTPGEERALIGLVDEITRQLNQWDSVRAVLRVAHSGLDFDLGFDGPVFGRSDQGLALARAVNVEQLMAVTIRVRADTAMASAAVFDARSGRVTSELQHRGRLDAPSPLAAAFVHELLGLEGPVQEVERLGRQSTDLEAVRQYRRGVDALERWRLEEAEEAFRIAKDRDPTFAMAFHNLALTLYWIGAGQPAGLTTTGPEISQLTARAVELSEDLGLRDRSHIVGFHRFQEGDYAAARAEYDGLVQRDPTDVYAHLLRGIVEYHDPWLTADGSRPRGDLNLAMRSFQEAVRLAPRFDLGYGHLFDITRSVLDERLPVYEPQRAAFVAPWDSATAPRGKVFLAAYVDSIVWLDSIGIAAVPAAARESGADELLELSMSTLRRWADYAEDEPKPLQELVKWTLVQLDRAAADSSNAAAASIALRALDYHRSALALKADTLEADWYLHSALLLAAGDETTALEAAQRGLELRDSTSVGAVPLHLANTFMARGRVDEALQAVALGSWRDRYFLDPETGDLFSDNGAVPVLDSIRVLGAMGVDDSRLEQAFAELDRRWPADEYSPEQLARLRRQAPASIAPALILAPDQLARWQTDLGADDPLWTALADSGEAAEASLRSAEAYEPPVISGTGRSFALAVAAQRLGEDSVAVRHLTFLLVQRRGVLTRDFTWGLVARAHLMRAQSQERLGALESAQGDYERVLRLWNSGDPGVQDAVTSATAAIERLRERDFEAPRPLLQGDGQWLSVSTVRTVTTMSVARRVKRVARER